MTPPIDRPVDRPFERERRATGEHPQTRAPRTPREADPSAGEHAWLSPAARSEVREILAEVFSERSASAESMIASRVKVDTARGLKRYRGAVGGLIGALLGMGGWAVAEVRSYGDERAEAARTAIAAEAKAEAAADEAMRVRTELDDARARVDQLEPKVDRALAGIEQLLAREAAEEPKPKPRRPR
jgi:hypothetical protein